MRTERSTARRGWRATWCRSATEQQQREAEARKKQQLAEEAQRKKAEDLKRQKELAEQKKAEEKKKELQEFIARFSANASKSRQATSRRKLLEKITLDDIQPSTRRYPAIIFQQKRTAGDQILQIERLGYAENDVTYFKDLDLYVNKGDKIAVLSKDSLAITSLFKILAGEIADGDAPNVAGGCPFQAWSVGEALRLVEDVYALAGPLRVVSLQEAEKRLKERADRVRYVRALLPVRVEDDALADPIDAEGVNVAAREAGATRLAVVSAFGADARAAVFYNRVKGEMEEAVAGLGFSSVVIAQPSFLMGDREALGQSPRPAEVWSERLLRPVMGLVPKAIRPIPAATVAAEMVKVLLAAPQGVRRLRSAAMQSAQRAGR